MPENKFKWAYEVRTHDFTKPRDLTSEEKDNEFNKLKQAQEVLEDKLYFELGKLDPESKQQLILILRMASANVIGVVPAAGLYIHEMMPKEQGLDLKLERSMNLPERPDQTYDEIQLDGQTYQIHKRHVPLGL